MKLASEESHAGYKNLGLTWLSLGSGCTDVLSFLKLGDVFTSPMTGNTALLAIAIGRAWGAEARSGAGRPIDWARVGFCQ